MDINSYNTNFNNFKRFLKLSLSYSEIEDIIIQVVNIYNKFKFLIIEYDSNIGENTVLFLNNSKIGGVITNSNNEEILVNSINYFNNKEFLKKVSITDELNIIENEELYGFTLYFHQSKSVSNVIDIIEKYNDLAYVFVYENLGVKFDSNNLKDWKIEYFPNYILGINSKIKKSIGVKNKFGLNYFLNQPKLQQIQKDLKFSNIDIPIETIYVEKPDHEDSFSTIIKDEKNINEPINSYKVEPSAYEPSKLLIPKLRKRVSVDIPEETELPKKEVPKKEVQKKEVPKKELPKQEETETFKKIPKEKEIDSENLGKLKLVNPDADKIETNIEKIDISNDLEAFFNNLKIPTVNFDTDTEKFDNEFKNYIKSSLKRTVKREDFIEKMVSGDNFLIWKKAFTHQTYDYDNNYEELEFIGDSILKYTFKIYTIKKFNNITARALTEFCNQFLSTTLLCTLGIPMKLIHWLVYKNLNTQDLNIKICEDLFESYIGALSTTADTIQIGLGPIFTYNYIVDIFSTTYFDPKMVYGIYKTSLIQRTEQTIGLGVYITDTTPTLDSKYRFSTTIKINPIFYPKFKEVFDIDLSGETIIATASGKSSKTSEFSAYSKAVDFMEKKYNFTYENCFFKKCDLKLFKHDKQLALACKEKVLKEYNCDYLEFDAPDNCHGITSVTIILYGINSKDPDTIIQKRNKKLLCVYRYDFDPRKDKIDDKKLNFKAEEGALNEYLSM